MRKQRKQTAESKLDLTTLSKVLKTGQNKKKFLTLLSEGLYYKDALRCCGVKDPDKVGLRKVKDGNDTLFDIVTQNEAEVKAEVNRLMNDWAKEDASIAKYIANKRGVYNGKPVAINELDKLGRLKSMDDALYRVSVLHKALENGDITDEVFERNMKAIDAFMRVFEKAEVEQKVEELARKLKNLTEA